MIYTTKSFWTIIDGFAEDIHSGLSVVKIKTRAGAGKVENWRRPLLEIPNEMIRQTKIKNEQTFSLHSHHLFAPTLYGTRRG